MNTWSSGYISEITYTHNYFVEFCPLYVEFALANAGYGVPPIEIACELGFGQGISINMHASSQLVRWWGNDFNPTQAAYAQELAKQAGNQAVLDDSSFEQFCSRSDLPEFNFIALHGIWSWISDENRKVIVDFINKKLKVGGVLYISYNTQPGWGAAIPMRDLINEYVKTMTATGKGITQRISEALQFTERLFATNPGYIQSNPDILKRFNKLKEQDRKYLAHEYFNQNWLPISFSKMNELLSEAKLTYTTSTTLLAQVSTINGTSEQIALLQTIEDPIFRETVRDFILNQQFRKDLWVKGPRILTSLEKKEYLRKQRVCLVKNRQDVKFKFHGFIGEISLQEAIYAPIVDALIDHEPKTIAQLEAILSAQSINFEQLIEAILVLVGNGILVLAQDPQVVLKVKKSTENLNNFIKERSRCQHEIQYLASPLTGGGVGLSRFGQLFLLALQSGKKTPSEWASYVWQILEEQQELILKDGVALKSSNENLNELTEQAKAFEMQLPILKALQII